MAFYADAFKALHSHNVRYMVVGGVAISLYGIPRMTQDLDIIISLDEENVSKTVTALTSIGYAPRVPVDPQLLANLAIRKQWREEKNMLVFSFFRGHKEYQAIDILFDHALDFNECYERRTTVSFASLAIPVLPADDLILLKRAASREQDISDIAALEQHIKKEL